MQNKPLGGYTSTIRFFESYIHDLTKSCVSKLECRYFILEAINEYSDKCKSEADLERAFVAASKASDQIRALAMNCAKLIYDVEI